MQYDHVLIYDKHSVQPKRPEDIHITREPLKVLTRPGLSIGANRRLDLKIKYPIRYDQRVSDIGKMANADVLSLLRYLDEIRIGEERDRVALIKAMEQSVPMFRDIDLEASNGSNEKR